MATKNELSPFEKEIRNFLDKPAGSLLYIAERALKGAIRAIDDYDPEQASEIHTPMLDIRKHSKKPMRIRDDQRWNSQHIQHLQMLVRYHKNWELRLPFFGYQLLTSNM